MAIICKLEPTLMNYIEHVYKCNRHDLMAFRPFILENIKLGNIRHEFVNKLLAFKDVFKEMGTAITLSKNLKSFSTRNHAISEVVNELILQGHLPKLRNEFYPVTTSFYKPPFFQLDRAAVPYFGVRAFGVHLNGFTKNSNGSLDLWIARRAKDRLICPGMLDNIVGGGQPIGLGIMENLIKECTEEASITKDLSTTAIPVGAISYMMETEAGLRHDTLFCFDLKLSDDFVPKNRDGEISNFYRWPIQRVAQIVNDGFEFKFNCNLVLIDFLIRHGFITPDHPHYTKLIKGLRF